MICNPLELMRDVLRYDKHELVLFHGRGFGLLVRVWPRVCDSGAKHTMEEAVSGGGGTTGFFEPAPEWFAFPGCPPDFLLTASYKGLGFRA